MSADLPQITLQELQRLTDEVPVMLACYDARTQRCLYANSGYASLGGLTPEQALGRTIAEIIGVDAATHAQPMLDRVLNEKIAVSFSRSYVTPHGDEAWIDVSLVPSGEPGVERTFVIISDISARRRAEVENRNSSERLHKFIAASLEGIAFHVDGVITDVNPALLRMLGRTPEEMVGKRSLEFVPQTERVKLSEGLRSVEEISFESLMLHKDGHVLPVETTWRKLDWHGHQQGISIVRDLSEPRAAEERLRFLALHDVLTGLPNRAAMNDHLARLVAEARQNNWPFAVFFIDLDQLKRVNDSLGHGAGDGLLAAVAQRLLKFCQDSAWSKRSPLLARLGGDEFVVTFSHTDAAASLHFSQQLQATLQQPIGVLGRELVVTASVGVASYPGDGDTPSQLLQHADAAMYLAKASGRNTTRFFDQSMALAADRALTVEAELGRALQNHEFDLYYQPEMSADGKQVMAVSALIRWRHRTRGLLEPDQFIAIAEGLHLIVPIGQWVLDTALAQVPRWRELGWKKARVSVNLSSNQFRAPEFTSNVLASLARLGLAGNCLELDVTERMLMSDDAATAMSLNVLRQAGILLAIDDFGTGYSSLSRLRFLPIEKLKIDRSFIRELPNTHSAAAVVNSILELAQGLGLTAVAAGVETEEQRECLDAMGCRVMQGFLFARPMPAAAFCEWLEALLARG